MDLRNTTDNQLTLREIPALWGGIECSITRVNGNFQDQLQLAGHYDRPADIDLIAQLGVKALRFPILYERHKPVEGRPIDWTWADDRINRIRQHNITPIIGLVHHGSGPAYTNMLSNQFAPGVASFAAEVANRYPDVEYYTPINEPLTTARFSGLYGIWYPHHRNDRSFCKMLLNELAAVVLSMQEIRKVNPAAKLVQTEDLGKTYAVKNLQYQADYENERRWLSFDILCGRLDPDHFMWQYFIDNGISKRQLEFFLNNPCPPDIMGLNYYVTSERFLDDNVDAYPAHMHGGNHIEKYVDTEAARVQHSQPSGLKVLLREVQDRYSLPMAMTEVHLHCTREEQMRWFKEIWETCCELKNSGVNIQAVTAWSLFGAFGWNKLLTSPECDYEPGVFDLRAPKPRITATGKLIRAYAHHEKAEFPILNLPGWWQRPGRFHPHFLQENPPGESVPEIAAPRLLIIGENLLTDAIVRACVVRNLPCRVEPPGAFNISVDSGLSDKSHTWAVVYTGSGENGQSLHAEWTEELARHSASRGIKFLKISTPTELNDRKFHDVDEDQQSFSSLESLIFSAHSEALVVRTGVLFSPWHKDSFPYQALEKLRSGRKVRASEKFFSTYSYVPDVVDNALDLLIDGVQGVCHLAHPEMMSAFDFAGEICKHAGIPVDYVMPYSTEGDLSVLIRCTRYKLMPSIYCSIEKFVRSSGMRLDGKGKVLLKSH